MCFLATAATSPDLVLNIGLLGACLTVVWLGLQIFRSFMPKDAYATKAELAELKKEVGEEMGMVRTNLHALRNSIQTGFVDLHHAIGVLEGKIK